MNNKSLRAHSLAAAAIVGADLTDKAFWAKGLQSYEAEIDEFVALLEQ